MNTTLSLTPAQRNDARAALALLAPFGLTMEQAARLAIGKRVAVTDATLAQVATDFLRAKLNAGCRPATFNYYEERINRVSDAFAGRMMNSITRSEFAAWLAQSSDGRASRAATARAARALWNYAAALNPPAVSSVITSGLEFSPTPNGRDGSRKFLGVEQAKRLMRNIPQRYRSAVALAMFAGIRPEEIAGDGKEKLTWAAVAPEERLIRVPGEISKTGQTRIIEELPEAVWHWLTPQERSLPVCPVAWRSVLYAARDAIGLSVWPQDCLRHSFATYALALTAEPGRVAMWLGHNGNPTMLHRHYRGLATKAQAESFFALRPS